MNFGQLFSNSIRVKRLSSTTTHFIWLAQKVDGWQVATLKNLQIEIIQLWAITSQISCESRDKNTVT